jgi:hypothetical protein
MGVQVFVFFPDAAKVGVKDIKVSRSLASDNHMSRQAVCVLSANLCYNSSAFACASKHTSTCFW